MGKRQFQLTSKAIGELRQAEQRTRDVHELRRLQAVRLYGSGLASREIQAMVNCGERSIRDWAQQYRAGGVSALASHWQGGNANKLSQEQRADLKVHLQSYSPDQVLASAERVSQGQYWTVSDLRLAIQAWYGVTYQKADTYQTLLHQCGFSYQRAARVYRSRPSAVDIAAIEAQLEKK